MDVGQDDGTARIEQQRALGQQLRALRRARGMTLEETAERAGMSVRQVQRLEAGAVDPRWSALRGLALTLGVSLAALLLESDGPTPPDTKRARKPLGRQLRALRESRGLTLSELAAQSGLTARYLQRVEHNRQSPTARVLLKLAGALSVRVSALFDEGDLA
jgi:transcriptional regulator with XRE-family HTH domain